MTWTPRKTESRADFVARTKDDSFKPRLVMPLRVSLAIFGVLATLIIIALLLIIASS